MKIYKLFGTESEIPKKACDNSDNSRIGLFEALKHKKYRKPISLVATVFFLVHLSGSMTLLSYAGDICYSLGFAKDPYSPAILITSMRLIGCFIFFALKNFGRRFLLISTTSIMCFSLISEAMTVFVQDSYEINSHYMNWIKVSWIALYLIVYGAGAGIIPFFLAGELAPIKVSDIF